MQVITLELSELEDIIHRTAVAVAEEFRKDRVPEKEWMTKRDLAAHWQCSVATIDRRMTQGLPFQKHDNGHPRFRRSTVDNWLNERF